ncbi:Uma2 family endonuclease [Plantactinospora sp. S1510]|uniref:Uma2 family endonuclease n=1 Tax=Plantactinospora alkalitolerans TaxID=2789879 RepID=A0ABS0GSR6_9ACTN|nr:Uma2 family endonuclease [Plantactinospora alkalitolerans]MBF9129236.1 Uma2 family endonuclease [Plantactinospora alkalitolerans]
MTAQPVGSASRRPWSPDPLRQRLANYTIEDVLAFPDDAPRVELRDGVIIVVPSPTFGHQTIANLLWLWFRQHAPLDYEPVTAVGVAISHRDTLEPDVLLLRRPVVRESHYFDPDQVVVAVEVVSPGTKRRDRLEKPADYAAAGIRYFWRIEQEPVHVHAYELVGDRYELVADSAEELVLAKPFEVRLRIRDIAP